jgi:hypothetical protein
MIPLPHVLWEHVPIGTAVGDCLMYTPDGNSHLAKMGSSRMVGQMSGLSERHLVSLTINMLTHPIPTHSP